MYQSSYERLNELAIATGYDFSNEQMLDSPRLAIPGETDDFLNDVLINQDPDLNVTDEQFDEILSIAERRTRLSENNLIFATAFTWLQDTRKIFLIRAGRAFAGNWPLQVQSSPESLR